MAKKYEKCCKTCGRFRQGYWHDDGGKQCGGYCKTIHSALALCNSELIWKDEFYVPWSFGCVFHIKPEDIVTEDKDETD